MEDLIQPAPGGDARGALAIGALVVALLACLGTGAIDLLAPVEGQTPVGSEAVELARARKSRSLFDGSLANWVEQEWRQHSRVRTTVAPYWSAALLAWAGTAPHDVVVGKEGWLFLRNRVHCGGIDREKAIRGTVRCLEAAERAFASAGTRLLVAPITRKSVACEEMLPSGVDAAPSFDADLVDALDRAGLEVIDVGPAFRALEPEDRYYPYDTHWAPPAVAKVAEVVAAALPEWRLESGDLERVDQRSRPIRGLLSFVAIPESHPAADFIVPEGRDKQVLAPTGSARRMATTSISVGVGQKRTRPVDAALDLDVAVVGSSFTDHFGFAEAVAEALQRPVIPGGEAATPFMASLGWLLTDLDGTPPPPVIVYEFPSFEAFRGAGPLHRSSSKHTEIYTRLARATRVLGPDVAPRIDVIPPGTAGSSMHRAEIPGPVHSAWGDDLVLLEIAIRSAAPSEWALRGPGPYFKWTAPAGESTITLPILHTQNELASVVLAATNAAAVSAEVRCNLSVDVDLENAIDLGLHATDDRNWVLDAAEIAAAPRDVLAVEWEGDPTVLDLIVRGRRPDGEPVRIERSIVRPRTHIALISLLPLRNGTVESITVERRGPGTVSRLGVRLAHMLRD